MNLYYVPSSPFARKVIVAVLERGLDDRINRVVLNPWDAGNPVSRFSPVGKVPVLEIDENITLYDLPIICEYLDSLGAAPRLFPDAGPDRWKSLQRQALGDALLDAMIARRMESRRADGERSPGWMARQAGIVNRCLDAMERDAAELKGAPTIGSIAYLCALGHLDFRFPDEDWRPGRPNLARWYEDFAARASARACEPQD